jgi:hypothetical protein
LGFALTKDWEMERGGKVVSGCVGKWAGQVLFLMLTYDIFTSCLKTGTWQDVMPLKSGGLAL